MFSLPKVALRLAALCACPLGPRPLDAQAARHLDTLFVGHAPLSLAYMHPDSSESIVFVPDSADPGRPREVGRVWAWQRIVQGGTRTLFRVSHFVSPRTEVTDSIATAEQGIVPLWEISHQTSKLMHLRFEGRRVAGDVTPTGGAKERIDQRMALPPFNSSDMGLLLQSLPLRPGFSALVATYEYESGGLRLDTLRVVGIDSTVAGGGEAPEPSLKVRISRGKESWVTFWVDRTRHATLREEYASRDRGWTLRIVRQRPTP